MEQGKGRGGGSKQGVARTEEVFEKKVGQGRGAVEGVSVVLRL